MKRRINYEDGILSTIHNKANISKNECFFIGFIEGVLADGRVDQTEVEPLVAECLSICRIADDEDAGEIVAEASAGHLQTATELLELLNLIAEMRLKKIDLSCTRSAANRFLGFCAGINCDAQITLTEARGLLEKLDEQNDLSLDPRVDALRHELVDALEDGHIDADEVDRIGHLITALVGDSYADTGIPSSETIPVIHDLDDISEGALEGKAVLVTGQFAFGTRAEVGGRLAEAGAIVKKTASRQVDIAIVGSNGSPHYTFSHHGGKLAKLLEFRRTGPVPRIYVEAQFRRLFS